MFVVKSENLEEEVHVEVTEAWFSIKVLHCRITEKETTRIKQTLKGKLPEKCKR